MEYMAKSILCAFDVAPIVRSRWTLAADWGEWQCALLGSKVQKSPEFEIKRQRKNHSWGSGSKVLQCAVKAVFQVGLNIPMNLRAHLFLSHVMG